MMTQELQLLTNQFQLLKLHLTVQLKQGTTLPAFKGAMWHGLLGESLKAHSEQCYQVFYGAHDEQQPKPYAIAPDGDHKTQWHKEELLNLELTLFGDACQLAQHVIDAMSSASLNSNLGIGEKRAAFKLLSVSSATPSGLRVGLHTFSLADWMRELPHYTLQQEVALSFITPVRAKYQNKVLRNQAPELDFWVNQCLRRLTQLSRFWVLDDQTLFDAIYAQTLSAIPQDLDWQSDCYFEDWVRYSTRHEKKIPIGGLKGQVACYGDVHALLPILKVGELLQVGGKTTFGLGKYRLMV
nr:CRISPR system precrRNA processing endoribonuclease RAMP protein Cas6 [Vibrio alfacsensis]